ncbi:acetyltransferase, GNAT family [Clostridium sp. KLE 1755]|nr:acetyltransferase, GNAT family [Clostridium sp. KLE 1755]
MMLTIRSPMIFIETDRLILRNYQSEDFSDYYEYMCLPYTAQEEDFEPFTLQQCREAVNERLTDDSFIAAELKENHKMIGDLCFRCQEYETFEIAYDFNVAYENKGFASEAGKALVDYLFSVLNARRITACCNDTNLKSARLLERLGFRLEGHFLEDASFKKDAAGRPVYISSFYYALLRREWL